MRHSGICVARNSCTLHLGSATARPLTSCTMQLAPSHLLPYSPQTTMIWAMIVAFGVQQIFALSGGPFRASVPTSAPLTENIGKVAVPVPKGMTVPEQMTTVPEEMTVPEVNGNFAEACLDSAADFVNAVIVGVDHFAEFLGDKFAPLAPIVSACCAAGISQPEYRGSRHTRAHPGAHLAG